MRKVRNLTAMVETHLDQGAREFALGQGNRPMAIRYGCDNTDARMRVHQSVKAGMHQHRYRRVGGHGFSLLLQQVWLAGYNTTGELKVAFLTHRPKEMPSKKDWDFMAEFRSFCPLPPQMGCTSVWAVQVDADGGIIDSFFPKVSAYVDGYAEAKRHTLTPEKFQIVRYLGWAVPGRCQLHVMHKGYEWGVGIGGQGDCSEQLLKDVFAVIEGVREGSYELSRCLPAYLLLFVTYVDVEFSDDVLRAFWALWNVDAEIHEVFVELGVMWDGVYIKVRAKFRGNTKVLEQLSANIQALAKVRKFSASR
jgi:hypothetical protein